MTAATPMARRAIVKQRTRQEILGHALNEVTATGDTCLRSIAKSMSMTAPGLYRYFPNAAVLHRAVATQVLLAAENNVTSWTAYQRWAEANPGRYAFLAKPGHRDLMARLHELAQQGGAA